MKAVILAAGLGSRLGDKTRSLPKGMLPFLGKPLLEWQIESLKSAGINEIIIVTGHYAECIDFSGITYVHNPNYSSTNMLESLMCAREYLAEGFILSYADIIYDTGLVSALMNSSAHVGVAADLNWKLYWTQRFGSPTLDLETFSVDSDGQVTELGKDADSSEGITHRYVGLLKFSMEGAKWLLRAYDNKEAEGSPWKQSGKEFKQGYLTDILDNLIREGRTVSAVETVNGWMEFDEPSDFEMAESLSFEGALGLLGKFSPLELVAQKNSLCYEYAVYSADLLSDFFSGRKGAASKLGGAYSAPNDSLIELKELKLDNCRPETFGWFGVITEHILKQAVTNLQSDSSQQAIKVINCLQKQFEVHKALFACYRGDKLNYGVGPFLFVNSYIYLAFGLATLFQKSNNFNYLNTLLKVNDLLVSDRLYSRDIDKKNILLCLKLEAEFMGRYYEI